MVAHLAVPHSETRWKKRKHSFPFSCKNGFLTSNKLEHYTVLSWFLTRKHARMAQRSPVQFAGCDYSDPLRNQEFRKLILLCSTLTYKLCMEKKNGGRCSKETRTKQLVACRQYLEFELGHTCITKDDVKRKALEFEKWALSEIEKEERVSAARKA